MKVLLAPTLSLARRSEPVAVSVEAEYGDTVVEGCRYTAAHHAPKWQGNPCPCVDYHIPLLREGETILISHSDLDTLGGVLRAMGRLDVLGPPAAGFWALAAFVDIHGPHRLHEAGASSKDVSRLWAYWAWAKGEPRFPRDQVSDVTEHVNRAAQVLLLILGGDPGLLEKGAQMVREENELNQRTFVFQEGPVLVRVAEAKGDFCNHLYSTPGGTPGQAVVSLNKETGAITVSLAEPTPRVSCREIVQALWGMEAGGHPGIAGSPRGKMMEETDLEKAARLLRFVLEEE